MKKFIILVLSIFLLTGCYDYHELNDLEIVSSMLVDMKDDKYVVSIEVLDTSKSAKNGSFFLSGEGDNFEQAMNNIFYNSAMTPFYSHMTTLIISEDVAKKGLEKHLDFLLRDTQFRKDFYIFVTDDIDQFLEYETEPAESIGEIAKMSAKRNHEKNGRYKTSTFRELVYHYLRDNYYVLGSINIKDEKISLDKTYAVIDNKLGFEIDKEAVLLENLIYENNNTFQIYGDYNYEIHGYKFEREIKEDKIVLSLKGHARLLDSINTDSLDEKELEKLEKNLNDKVEKKFNDIVEYSKRMDHDIFNFNFFYYMYYPKLVKENSWKNLEYEIKSELYISEKGLLLNALGGSKDGK